MSFERFNSSLRLSPSKEAPTSLSFPPAPEHTKEVPPSHLYPGDHMVYDGCMRTIKSKVPMGGSGGIQFFFTGGGFATYDPSELAQISA